MLDVYNYYKQMQEQCVILYFKGEITNSLLTSILQLVDDRLEHKSENVKTKKKVFSVLLECLQNIYNYQQLNEFERDNLLSAALMVRRTEDSYHIITGNFVKNDIIHFLKSKIDKVNELDAEALKDFYKEVLLVSEPTPNGGAGLGIIDIARKSGSEIFYHFEPSEENYSFYSLEVKIPLQ